MNPAGGRPSREAVLDAFAVESEPNRSTLERYLRLYPEYAGELIDLSRELSREVCEDAAPLSAADQALIDAAWSQHAKAVPAATADPFVALTVDDWRAVAHVLDVPRQVVTALRERRVSLASIPRRIHPNQPRVRQRRTDSGGIRQALAPNGSCLSGCRTQI